MKNHFTFVRVRYAETDQMGVVHHGNYAQYLELARIDWLEQFHISYKDMENEGVMLPVYELDFKFLSSAKFGDKLTIETSLRKLSGPKIIFDYKIYNQDEKFLTTASSTLIFMDANSKRPIRCPKYIEDKILS